MTDPRRLREDCESPLERALLEAGASYRSSPATKAKTLAALGVGSAAMSVAGVSAGSTLLAKIGWPKLVATLSVIGAVSSIPIVYYASRSPSEPQHAPAAGPLKVAAMPAPLAPAWPATPAADASEPLAARAASPSAATSLRPPRNEPRFTPSQSSTSAALTAELAALDRARSTLARGDARGALSLLDAYFRAYPRGRLTLEGEAMRIDALARSGQTEQAKQRAAAFLRRHPNSVLTTRMRGYLQR